jgi:hypothetical protein
MYTSKVMYTNQSAFAVHLVRAHMQGCSAGLLHPYHTMMGCRPSTSGSKSPTLRARSTGWPGRFGGIGGKCPDSQAIPVKSASGDCFAGMPRKQEVVVWELPLLMSRLRPLLISDVLHAPNPCLLSSLEATSVLGGKTAQPPAN